MQQWHTVATEMGESSVEEDRVSVVFGRPWSYMDHG